MWFYVGLRISIGLWVILGIYVFSEIKKNYDRGAVIPVKLLVIWFIMWGFHHLAVILSALNSVWPIPMNTVTALVVALAFLGTGAVLLPTGMIEFRSLQRSTGQDISQLVTTGIYRWSRNPQFIGWFLVLSGISLAGHSGLALVLTLTFAIVIHLYTIWLEEPYLERIFGKEYTLYRSRTPRYIGILKEKR